MAEKLEKVVIDERIRRALGRLRVPKAFGMVNRRDYTSGVLSAMEQANLDFYDIALKSLELYGKEVLVYPHVNLQARISMGCNAQCGFCIERFGNDNALEIESRAYADRLEESIQMLQEQDVFPSVTITGGEPCMDYERLAEVFRVLERRKVAKFNVNTNGKVLVQQPEFLELFRGTLPYLNISMHHWSPEKSAEIMGGKRNLSMDDITTIANGAGGGQYGNAPRLRLQCVLLEGYVHDLSSMQDYLNHAKSAGVDNVSFRGLSKLSCGNYDVKVVSMGEVLDNLAHAPAPGWEFVCQNIADWYCYEDWKYGKDENGKWMDVHLNFSNMANLRRFELGERERGKMYAREFVVFEDGVFSAGWNKDLGFLKK